MSTQTARCLGSLGRQALSGRAGKQRSALRRAQWAALRVLLPTLLLILSLAGCAPFPPPRPTATPLDCATTLRCRVVLPRCGPAVTPDQGDMGIWYAHFTMPRNAASVVGFQPLVPTSIPEGASWDGAALVQAGAVSTPTQPSLFHATYGRWPPRGKGYALDPVFAVDETTGHLDPLSYLIGDNQVVQIQSKRAVTVAGQPMTVYHLVYPASSILHDTFLAIEVLWHAGPLTMRELGVASPPGAGIEEVGPNPRQGFVGGVLAWYAVRGAYETGDDDGVLLRMAASVAPYTGCGQ